MWYFEMKVKSESIDSFWKEGYIDLELSDLVQGATRFTWNTCHFSPH